MLRMPSTVTSGSTLLLPSDTSSSSSSSIPGPGSGSTPLFLAHDKDLIPRRPFSLPEATASATATPSPPPSSALFTQSFPSSALLKKANFEETGPAATSPCVTTPSSLDPLSPVLLPLLAFDTDLHPPPPPPLPPNKKKGPGVSTGASVVVDSTPTTPTPHASPSPSPSPSSLAHEKGSREAKKGEEVLEHGEGGGGVVGPLGSR
ncbi:hypothetical protein HMI56_003340 [Coelomomyces lativittatus]|nr:hypothetical protein HMI56_003340 [Coelomomyces lativittatus]